MKCIKCGNEFTNQENICPNCGTQNVIENEILSIDNGPQSFTRNGKDISIEELMNGKKEETNKLDFEIQGNVKKEGVLSDFNQSANNQLSSLVINENSEQPKKKNKKGFIIGGSVALLLIVLVTSFILLKDDKKELKPNENKTEEKQPIEENPTHNIEEPSEPENPENQENPENPENPESPEEPKEEEEESSEHKIEPTEEITNSTKKVTYTPLTMSIPYDWEFIVSGSIFIGRNNDLALYLSYIPGSYNMYIENVDFISTKFKDSNVNVTNYAWKSSHSKDLLLFYTQDQDKLVLITSLGEQYTIEAMVQYKNITEKEAIDKITEILSSIKGKLPDILPVEEKTEDGEEITKPFEFQNALVDTGINLFSANLR